MKHVADVRYEDLGLVSSGLKLIVPGSVESIGDNAVRGHDFTSVELSEGLKSIGEKGIAVYRYLRSLVLPSTLQRCGAQGVYCEASSFSLVVKCRDLKLGSGFDPFFIGGYSGKDNKEYNGLFDFLSLGDDSKIYVPDEDRRDAVLSFAREVGPSGQIDTSDFSESRVVVDSSC